MSRLPDQVTPQYMTPVLGRRTSGMAVASLVLGIVALPLYLLFCSGLVVSLVGLVLGVVSLVQIRGRPGELKGKGWAIAGMVLGVMGPMMCGGILVLAVFRSTIQEWFTKWGG